VHLPLSLYNDMTMSTFKLSSPLVKEFRFNIWETTNPFEPFIIRRPEDAPNEEADKLAGNFSITIRQGTFGEDKMRSELFWARKRIYEAGKEVSTEITNITPQSLVENDIAITICDISGLELDGMPMPEFVQSGSYKKPKDRDGVVKFVNALPSQWVDEIYGAVLEVNPKWDTKSQ